MTAESGPTLDPTALESLRAAMNDDDVLAEIIEVFLADTAGPIASGVETLREAGLAGPDDAGENEVRCGDEVAGVEDPRVVDERASGVEVLADEDAFAAEAAFGEERGYAPAREAEVSWCRGSRNRPGVRSAAGPGSPGPGQGGVERFASVRRALRSSDIRARAAALRSFRSL